MPAENKAILFVFGLRIDLYSWWRTDKSEMCPQAVWVWKGKCKGVPDNWAILDYMSWIEVSSCWLGTVYYFKWVKYALSKCFIPLKRFQQIRLSSSKTWSDPLPIHLRRYKYHSLICSNKILWRNIFNLQHSTTGKISTIFYYNYSYIYITIFPRNLLKYICEKYV